MHPKEKGFTLGLQTAQFVGSLGIRDLKGVIEGIPAGSKLAWKSSQGYDGSTQIDEVALASLVDQLRGELWANPLIFTDGDDGFDDVSRVY